MVGHTWFLMQKTKIIDDGLLILTKAKPGRIAQLDL
jgi:hypothetical protein